MQRIHRVTQAVVAVVAVVLALGPEHRSQPDESSVTRHAPTLSRTYVIRLHAAASQLTARPEPAQLFVCLSAENLP
ncbi:hypothetical protein B0T24DRAFT_603790 [Lasiosphaeria ovina]|uniref:Secreted protein n=1 Tax=Lasiosphaeria ovina TaxID=92902 RepID=A0AAE0NKI4_9PEZI|nr:hypothetical protein B0T24DRAFT_603790 [Lasiosphaeria ovina]